MIHLLFCRGDSVGKIHNSRSWLWCILTLWSMSLPCILSECMGRNISVSIEPSNDLYIKYGDPLEIFCTADNYSSNDIRFQKGHGYLESEIINLTTRRLYILKPNKQAASYYCVNEQTKEICTVRVLVESPPIDVTDFKCMSKNFDVLNCFWTDPESNYAYINYSLSFFVNKKLVKPECIAKRLQFTSTRYCEWTTTTHPRYRQQEEELFMSMVACNKFGCNNQNFTRDHQSIVKPDPPTDLRVVEYGVDSVVLKWHIPINIVDILRCGVEHIIEYQIAKVDEATHFRRVDTSSLPRRNKTYKFVLKDLPYAHMHYEVKIYIKSKKAVSRDYWSDYAFTIFSTLGDKPKRPPDVIIGAFDQTIYNNRRILNVYLKPLKEFEEAGANYTYKVLVSQINETKIEITDINKRNSYVTINTTLDASDVTVWSSNIYGTSINSSHIYIPKVSDTRALKVVSFTKHEYANGTYELSWVRNTNVDNYTLFWCRQYTRQFCDSEINFTVIGRTENYHTIDLPMDNSYQFAISANKGSDSGGMHWPKCEISRNKFVMYHFVLHIEYDSVPKTSVTLRWALDCVFRKGIIIGYNISYCPIVQASNSCDNSVDNDYIYIEDPAQRTATIRNILSSRTYDFTFVLDTIYGEKIIEMRRTDLVPSITFDTF